MTMTDKGWTQRVKGIPGRCSIGFRPNDPREIVEVPWDAYRAAAEKARAQRFKFGGYHHNGRVRDEAQRHYAREEKYSAEFKSKLMEAWYELVMWAASGSTREKKADRFYLLCHHLGLTETKTFADMADSGDTFENLPQELSALSMKMRAEFPNIIASWMQTPEHRAKLGKWQRKRGRPKIKPVEELKLAA